MFLQFLVADAAPLYPLFAPGRREVYRMGRRREANASNSGLALRELPRAALRRDGSKQRGNLTVPGGTDSFRVTCVIHAFSR